MKEDSWMDKYVFRLINRMSVKKNIIVLLILIIVMSIALTKCKTLQKMRVYNQYKHLTVTSKYMMHALGGIDDHAYTNSIEAMEKAYALGYRLFEVDVNLTSDDKAVLVHGWSKKDYKLRIGYGYYDEKKADENGKYIPTYEQFMQYRIQGLYTATSFEELIQFMTEHRDMYVMIDVGNRSYEDTSKIYRIMVETAERNDNTLQRMIVGGHTKEMISAVKKTYNWTLYNLYFANEEKRNAEWENTDDFISYCKKNRISSFSTATKNLSKKDAEKLLSSGLISYVFTINNLEEENYFRELGIDIVGTDFLRN